MVLPSTEEETKVMHITFWVNFCCLLDVSTTNEDVTLFSVHCVPLLITCWCQIVELPYSGLAASFLSLTISLVSCYMSTRNAEIFYHAVANDSCILPQVRCGLSSMKRFCSSHNVTCS